MSKNLCVWYCACVSILTVAPVDMSVAVPTNGRMSCGDLPGKGSKSTYDISLRVRSLYLTNGSTSKRLLFAAG